MVWLGAVLSLCYIHPRSPELVVEAKLRARNNNAVGVPHSQPCEGGAGRQGCARSRGRTSSPARPTPAACSSPTASARPPPQPPPPPALPSPGPGSAGAWGGPGLRSWPEPRPSARAQPAAAATQRQRGESEPGDACRCGRAHLLLLPQLLRAPTVKATVLHEELLGQPAPVLNLRRRKPLRRCRYTHGTLSTWTT